jgi:hypothetical protein
MPRAEGPFDVKRGPLDVHAAAEGQLGRHSLAKTFQGGLEGTSVGEMLSAGTATPGSAGYVAIETVTGLLEGKAGTFRLQHSGILNRGEGSLHIQVIPDSGTDALTGLSGTMQIVIAPGGAHSYVFDYTL